MTIAVRRPTPRLLLSAVLAAALIAPAGAAAAQPAAARPAPDQVAAPVPQLAWQPCGPGLEPFLCATAEVPLDYDVPRGPKTTIALTKLPASGPAAERIGTLFTNPGGPGGSGVDFVQGAAQVVYPAALRARYDILGFDPRGVARSGPATCFRTAADEAASPLLAEGYPVTAAQERHFLGQARELAARCQLLSPFRLANASTANVARDMDLLRQAVGDERLHYAGYSYGTILGATYAKLFPSRVGRFVLDGPVNPVSWTGTGRGADSRAVPLGRRIGQGVGAHETFQEFARLCREGGPAHCLLSALGDPAVTVPAMFDRLLAAPLTVPLPDGGTVELTQQVAVVQTFTALYEPSLWPDLADFLLALIVETSPTGASATTSGAAAAAPDVATAARRLPTPLGARLRGEDYPSIGGALASICVDALRTGTPGRYPAAADTADAEAPYFGRARTWATVPCEYWAVADDDAYRGPWQQTTPATVLVIGTITDPATPYRHVRPYADHFRDARVLTLQGWGHTALLKSACVDDRVTTYLLTGNAPADGTTCAPDSVPFTGPASSQARTTAEDLPTIPAW